MSSNKREELINSQHFPLILMRDFLLPTILGNETSDVLYWSGKQLARQFPLLDETDIQESFEYCGFGNLDLVKKERNRDIYHLHGSIIETRLLKQDISFHLEAGFLSEQLFLTTKISCEVQVKILKNKTNTIVNLIVNY